MLNKVKTGLNIAILFMFVVAIIYGLIMIIYRTLNADSIINKNVISKENVDIYVDDKYLVKTDYTTFYSLEKTIQEIITAFHNDKVNELHNIMIKDLKDSITDTNKLREYYISNFKYDVLGEMGTSGYYNNDNLLAAYKVEKNTYICVVKSLNDTESTKIGIKIIDNNNYLISYLDI